MTYASGAWLYASFASQKGVVRWKKVSALGKGKAIKEEEPNEKLYLFIEQSFIKLDESIPLDSNFHLKFLLQLTQFLGFPPSSSPTDSGKYFDLMEGVFTKEEPHHPHYLSPVLAQKLGELFNEDEQMKITASERKGLLDGLLLYYELHLQDFNKVKSHKVLHEVLDSWYLASLPQINCFVFPDKKPLCKFTDKRIVPCPFTGSYIGNSHVNRVEESMGRLYQPFDIRILIADSCCAVIDPA